LNLDRIFNSKYIPTTDDMLHLRVTTTGVIETLFNYQGSPFRLVDVGGQRSERRKWIHCFENVTSVIFCMAINEYDMTLYEDDTVNRMQESIQLFEAICKERFLKNIPIIVFFE